MGWPERLERRRRVDDEVHDFGRRLESSSNTAEMGVAGRRARDSVGGRPVPAKLVMRTLILLSAIVAA